MLPLKNQLRQPQTDYHLSPSNNHLVDKHTLVPLLRRLQNHIKTDHQNSCCRTKVRLLAIPSLAAQEYSSRYLTDETFE